MEELAVAGNGSEFKALFADAHRHRFALALFCSFSRQVTLPTLQYLNQLDSWGTGYESLTEQYLDSTCIFKEAIVSILATLTKQERVRLSKRIKAGMARKVARWTRPLRATSRCACKLPL